MIPIPVPDSNHERYVKIAINVAQAKSELTSQIQNTRELFRLEQLVIAAHAALQPSLKKKVIRVLVALENVVLGVLALLVIKCVYQLLDLEYIGREIVTWLFSMPILFLAGKLALLPHELIDASLKTKHVLWLRLHDQLHKQIALRGDRIAKLNFLQDPVKALKFLDSAIPIYRAKRLRKIAQQIQDPPKMPNPQLDLENHLRHRLAYYQSLQEAVEMQPSDEELLALVIEQRLGRTIS